MEFFCAADPIWVRSSLATRYGIIFFVFVGTVNIYNNVWYVVVDNVMSVYMMVNVVCANICVVDNGQCSVHE